MNDAPRPQRSPTESPREQSYERLLSLLEQASAGEWALDKQIAVLEREKIGDCADDEVPPYTTSLDAALTLVPEGWHAIINWRDKLDGSSSVVLHQFPLPCRRVPEEEPFVIGVRTAALALCIAALKARSAR